MRCLSHRLVSCVSPVFNGADRWQALHGLTYALPFARVQEAPSADLERGMSVEAASAARLLYAALQPIRPHPDSQSYERFFMELDPGVLKSLTISTIFRFLRMALEVPAKEYLLLVPLVDGAQHARGRFGSERREKVMHTWPSGPCLGRQAMM